MNLDNVYFTHEEKRESYELVNLKARLIVEDGIKVAYVECELALDEQRLVLGRCIGSPPSSRRPVLQRDRKRRIPCGRAVRDPLG